VPSEPTYLGVDPSLNGTGICVLQGSQAVVVQTVDPGKLRGSPRLAFIRDALRVIIKERSLAFAAIENYSYDSVGRVFHLGEAGGVLRLCIFDEKLAYADVAPAALKKFATGNSGADKEAVMSVVRNGWNIDVADDNQADACVLAMIARGLTEGLIRPTRPQLEVLHAIKHPRIKSVVRARKRIKNFL
jgi:Holliday junction resolvasome RuvABC endonuclease subunit